MEDWSSYMYFFRHTSLLEAKQDIFELETESWKQKQEAVDEFANGKFQNEMSPNSGLLCSQSSFLGSIDFYLPMVSEKCPVEANPCGIIPLSPPDPAETGNPKVLSVGRLEESGQPGLFVGGQPQEVNGMLGSVVSSLASPAPCVAPAGRGTLLVPW